MPYPPGDWRASGPGLPTEFGSGRRPAAWRTAGELRTHFDGVDTWAQGDIDGDGAADFEIRFDGAVTLAGSDFVL